MYALDTNTVLDYFRGKGGVAENLLTRNVREFGRVQGLKVVDWHG